MLLLLIQLRFNQQLSPCWLIDESPERGQIATAETPRTAGYWCLYGRKGDTLKLHRST